LTGCGGGGGGGAAQADPPALNSPNIVIGQGGTSSAAPVYATGTDADLRSGITYPLYQNVARPEGQSPGGVSGSLTNDNDASSVILHTNVDGKAADVVFDPSTVVSHTADTLTAKKSQGGLDYTILLAGPASLDYALYGAWMQENGDQVLQSNELVAAAYGGLETPLNNMPTAGAFTYTGQTLGLGVDSAGNIAGIAGNLSLTADFASHSVNGTINNMALSTAAGVSYPGTTAQLNGGISGNGFNGTMDVKNASSAAVGSGTFDGRFFGPNAEEVAGKWAYDGSDGSKAIGAFGAKR